MRGFHAEGRGVGDLKADNLMVQVAADGSFQDCNVLDVGSSAVFSGQFSPSGPCMFALESAWVSAVPLMLLILFICECACVSCMQH